MPKVRTPEPTERMRRFADAYFVCLDPVQAAKEAGYSGNDKTLAVQATRLLQDDRVQSVLKERRQQLNEKTDNTMLEIVGRLKAIAASNIKSVASWSEWDDDNIRYKASTQISDEDAYAIKRIKARKRPVFDGQGNEVGESTEFDLEMHNKDAALKLLASYYGIDNDLNAAIQTLARYGIYLKRDEQESSGWKVEREA